MEQGTEHWEYFAEQVLHLLSDEILGYLDKIDRRTRLTDTHVSLMRKKIMAELQDLQDAVAALVAEDNVIVSEMDRLVALGGGVSAADVEAAAQAVKAEVAKLAAKVDQVDPPVTTPPPTA